MHLKFSGMLLLIHWNPLTKSWHHKIKTVFCRRDQLKIAKTRILVRSKKSSYIYIEIVFVYFWMFYRVLHTSYSCILIKLLAISNNNKNKVRTLPDEKVTTNYMYVRPTIDSQEIFNVFQTCFCIFNIIIRN